MKKLAALVAILAVCSAPVLAQNGGFSDLMLPQLKRRRRKLPVDSMVPMQAR